MNSLHLKRSATPRSSRSPSLPLYAALALGVSSAAAWALWPLPNVPRKHASPSPPIAGGRPAQADTPAQHPLDSAVFRAPLWVAPPPPPLPQPPPPPPPLKLQLIGISNANGVLSAVIYDPDTGQLNTVRANDRFARFEVVRLMIDQVELREGALIRVLKLRGERGDQPTPSAPDTTPTPSPTSKPEPATIAPAKEEPVP